VFKVILTNKNGLNRQEVLYHFLTDVDGIRDPQNKIWLEQGMRIAYGHMPKTIKFQYDKYQ
jgi:hypothetical protein